MAFTPEQEAYLAKLADAALKQEAFDAKLAELEAARLVAEAKNLPDFESSSKDKQAIAALQAAIAADPQVVKVTAELEALS